MFGTKRSLDLANRTIDALEKQVDILNREKESLLDRLMAQNFQDFAVARESVETTRQETSGYGHQNYSEDYKVGEVVNEA